MSKKFCPFLYSDPLYKNVKDFLDIQYTTQKIVIFIAFSIVFFYVAINIDIKSCDCNIIFELLPERI